MLNAARAQGRPIIVIAISTAAITQPTAIQMPPVTIQRMFSTRFSNDTPVPPAFLLRPDMAPACCDSNRYNESDIGLQRPRPLPKRGVIVVSEDKQNTSPPRHS